MKAIIFILTLFLLNCNFNLFIDDNKTLTSILNDLSQPTQKVQSLSFSSSSNSFNFQFDVDSIKRIDGIEHSLELLPSEVSDPKISISKNSPLHNASISILPSSIKKIDKTGVYSYIAVLNGKKFKISYQFLDQRGFDIKSLLKFSSSDIKQIDGVTSSLDNLPTDSSVVSSPIFNPVFPKYGLKSYTVSIVPMPDGSNVVRDALQGKYEYKVRIATENANREMVIYYRFQSQKEKDAVSSQPATIRALKENIFNSISEKDIKSVDNVSIGTRLPSIRISPNFSSSPYNINSLNININLDATSIVQNEITGEYSYTCTLSYVLSLKRTLSKDMRVVYTAGSKIGDISENNIKSIDNITLDNTKKASTMPNPPLFDTGRGVGGIIGVNVGLEGSNLAIIDDVNGLYNYSVKVEKMNISKTINVRYIGFLTNEQKEINALHTITESDIKGIDNISDNLSDRSSKLASTETRSITFGSTSLRGVTNLIIYISKPATYNDSTGTFTYSVMLRKHGATTTITTSEIIINYNGYRPIGVDSLIQDQQKISQFNALDLMAMDNINVSRSVFPTDAAPTFINQDKYGLTSSDYSITLQTLPNRKTYKLDKNNGTYYYKAIVSTRNGARKEISVSYSGFLTNAEDIINNDSGKLSNFTESNVKGWDGINESSSIYPSDLSSIPTFTGLPSTLHGLTGFKVELLGRAAFVDDPTGKYQYDVKISNAVGTASRTLTVTYNSFARRDFKLSLLGDRMIVSHFPLGYNPSSFSLKLKNGSSPFSDYIASSDIESKNLGSRMFKLSIKSSGISSSWRYLFSGISYRVNAVGADSSTKYSDIIKFDKHPLTHKVWMRDNVNGTTPSNGEKFGDRVAVSGNGKVMIASKGGDEVAIYEKDSNENWQYKQTLTGYAGAGLGGFNSISYDGSRFFLSNASSNFESEANHVTVVKPPNWSITVHNTTNIACRGVRGRKAHWASGHVSILDRQSDNTWSTSMNLGSCVLNSYSAGSALSRDGRLLVIGSVLFDGSNFFGRLKMIHLSSSINYVDSQASGFGFKKAFTGSAGDRLGRLGIAVSGDNKYVVAHSQSQTYASTSPSKSKINTYYLDDSDNTWKEDINFDIAVSSGTFEITGNWGGRPKDVGGVVLSQGVSSIRTLVVSFPKVNNVKIYKLNCGTNNRCVVDSTKSHQIAHTNFGYTSSDDPRFGTNVRISDDGLKLLISAVEATNFKSTAQGINAEVGVETTTSKGVVFLLTRSSVDSTTWTTLSDRTDASKEFGIFRPINPSGTEFFGHGLGFDANGKTIVVGSPLHDSGEKGKIYSFQ